MLDAAGVAYTALPYQHDPRAESFGLEAAHALGKDPACVFKTIMVVHDKNWATVMVPVSSTVDLKAAARELGWKKASLAAPSALRPGPATWWAASRHWARRLRHPRCWMNPRGTGRPFWSPVGSADWTSSCPPRTCSG